MDTPAPRTPRHRLTALAAVLMLVVTVPFAVSAVQLLRAAFGPELASQLQMTMIAYELDPAEFGLFLKLGAVVMAGVCLAAVLVAVGVFLRSELGRMAGLILFSFLGLVSVLMGLGAVTADPRPDGWMLAALSAPLNLAVLALLAARPVADDIARAGFYRQRRRQRPDDRTVRAPSG